MKTKHIRDKTWPIRPILRGVNSRWYETRYAIEIDIRFVIEPKHVPVIIQSVGFSYGGNWKDGLHQASLDSCTLPIGTQISIKAPTEPYIASFRIYDVPKDIDIVSINGSLEIGALSLPCILDIDTIRVIKKS